MRLPKKVGTRSKEARRAVHVTACIPAQTICVSILQACLLTLEMGQATPIGGKIMASDLELDAPKHIFLMVDLLWDWRVHRARLFFALYYNILPQSLRNMPIFWTTEERARLVGSHLLIQIAYTPYNVWPWEPCLLCKHLLCTLLQLWH